MAFCGFTAVAAAQSDLGYDPTADPFELLQDAKTEAGTSGKHILVIAGGDWCIWCHYLHAFLSSHDSIDKSFKETFVVVKAYLGDENFNEAFFATLPEAAGYPHFWVLDAGGSLLASENTLPLEDGGKSYDANKFTAFIAKWRDAL